MYYINIPPSLSHEAKEARYLCNIPRSIRQVEKEVSEASDILCHEARQVRCTSNIPRFEDEASALHIF